MFSAFNTFGEYTSVRHKMLKNNLIRMLILFLKNVYFSIFLFENICFDVLFRISLSMISSVVSFLFNATPEMKTFRIARCELSDIGIC